MDRAGEVMEVEPARGKLCPSIFPRRRRASSNRYAGGGHVIAFLNSSAKF